MPELDAFHDYLKNERRYSKHTVTAYVNDVKQFFSFIKSQYSLEAAPDITSPMVKSWIYELDKDKISPRSINRKLVAANTFYKFLLIQSSVKANPFKNISGPKTPKRLVEWIPENNMDSLFKEIAWEDDFSGWRDRVIFELLYGCGLRLAELISLSTGRVYTGERSLKVIGKRNKERIIPMNTSLMECLNAYMAKRKEAGFDTKEELLLTDKGEALYPMFVQRLTKKYLSNVSSAKKLSPHVLRHSFATHLLNNGADINAIKELLGHSSLAATQVYTHNSIERLKEIYKQSHPKS
jgi:integrase/recombinase XerC